ncbi:MAG TPA: peptide chain release factor 2 [Opitutales bacterium]|nr:peptide chain release factor 2 [Opitutales bacterium]
MIIDPEIKAQIDTLTLRAGHLWRFLDIEGKRLKVAELEARMAQSGFWDNQNAARDVMREANALKLTIGGLEGFMKRLGDLQALNELVESASDDEGHDLVPELTREVAVMVEELDRLEIASFLGGRFDNAAAIMSVHAGAGGTESCDWADMLLRMYLRWAERRGFKAEIEDLQPGEGAGVSRATIRVEGPFAYGYAKAERGVHRLVRISPFDSNQRRHTSFASVDVIAEVEDTIDIEINEADLRIDTYRASGKGGQHVNKTDSAVRMTHIPTGIVVACQNERSQIKNRERAMKTLKSRVYERLQDEKRAELEKFYGEKGEMGWGNQIRSYVLQPYQMVKDLRTGVQTSNVQGVLDGELDTFIHAWLRAGGPARRSKDIAIDD